ncbi:MAG: hypothetical protein ACTSWN_10415 [Promethearchaeota archaeon]
MDLRYVHSVSYQHLVFGLMLQAKLSWRLDSVKRDLNKGQLSLDEASRRMFSLLVLLAGWSVIKSWREINDIFDRCIDLVGSSRLPFAK